MDVLISVRINVNGMGRVAGRNIAFVIISELGN